MRTAVLGTGMVGQTIASKLVHAGHQVMMGSRTAGNEKAVEWTRLSGKNASHGTFAEAARFGDVVFNCTAGTASLQALELAGRENLKGKILVDVANPLDFSRGMPPKLSVCNTDSLAEQIQRAFPDVKVVKTLNTVNHELMANPALVPGDHTIFMSGNDAEAKVRVRELLTVGFGWNQKNIIDLGDITTARGAEMMLPLWIRLFGIVGKSHFNFCLKVGP
jgi:8-hydroxy-5-deazaflavin:NADPH oxidoreductase